MTADRPGRLSRWLSLVERGGNALPHPATLFAGLAALVLLLSLLGFHLGWSAVHPATGETITVVNLLSRDGLHRILLGLVENYTNFAPLGIVMVALLGLGIAESSGLLGAAIRLLVLRAPRRLLTFAIVMAGTLSNVASDLGYVLIIPLAGVIFHSMDRHPIAGMAAAFAGVSGGFSANLFIGTIDPLLAGLSTEAAAILDPQYQVLPTANYYFMAVSAVVIAAAGTWVTHRMVEPRLGAYQGEEAAERTEPLGPVERRGLRWVLVVAGGWVALLLAGLIPEHGLLRGPGNSLLRSPVFEGVIAVLLFVAGTLGGVYGFVTGRFRSQRDLVDGMAGGLKTLAAFLVLAFFAAQFVTFFRWSQLGLLLAVEGAHLLERLDLGLAPLLVLFVALSGFINLFMGSASAKWAILGPVFVPMFMLLGYSPELSQAVFRVGDSVTNVISPMMSFFALIVVYFEKYDKRAGLGTLITTMLPYSLTFFVLWTMLLVGWALLDLPLGPGAGIHYDRQGFGLCLPKSPYTPQP